MFKVTVSWNTHAFAVLLMFHLSQNRAWVSKESTTSDSAIKVLGCKTVFFALTRLRTPPYASRIKGFYSVHRNIRNQSCCWAPLLSSKFSVLLIFRSHLYACLDLAKFLSKTLRDRAGPEHCKVASVSFSMSRDGRRSRLNRALSICTSDHDPHDRLIDRKHFRLIAA